MISIDEQFNGDWLPSARSGHSDLKIRRSDAVVPAAIAGEGIFRPVPA